MIENFFNVSGELLRVFQFLFTGKPVGIHVHVNVHRIFHPLLPSVGLGVSARNKIQAMESAILHNN